MAPSSGAAARLPARAAALVLAVAVALAHAPAAAAEDVEPSCAAGGALGGAGSCLAGKNRAPNATACLEQGFDPARLRCGTCRILEKRLVEAAISGSLLEECLGCCREVPEVERFEVARLIADASSQDRDQDLHDFIKRKAPFFSRLEVEYQEGAAAALEFTNENETQRVVRADVSGWKSDHLVEFLSLRLEKDAGSGGGSGGGNADAAGGGVAMAASRAWTAEVQTCSGWRLNQLPEVRRFVKEPGHADTYAGLKVNFIPHHNPDLVFFNEHGEEIERLDLGWYNCDQIHKLMQDQGFKRKLGRRYLGEIRTCSGWRLNQLPEVRRFVLGKGNADSYVALRINFVPHHSPFLILLDDQGTERQRIDISDYSFQGLQDLMEEHGFRQKELL